MALYPAGVAPCWRCTLLALHPAGVAPCWRCTQRQMHPYGVSLLEKRSFSLCNDIAGLFFLVCFFFWVAPKEKVMEGEVTKKKYHTHQSSSPSSSTFAGVSGKGRLNSIFFLFVIFVCWFI